MQKVCIYARVSTSEGNQNYDRQIYDLETLIQQHGYSRDQIEIYAEMVSGYQKERPELTKLQNKIESDPKYYKTIYCTEISRVGRNPKHTREIVDRWIELGVPLYIQSIGQSTIDTSGRRNTIVSIILQVLMEFADLESQQMKNRMKSGKIKRVVNGKTSTHNLPYGYISDDKGYLIIDEKESEIVKQIFDSYNSGIGTRIIAETLNEMNIPTKLNITNPDKVFKFNKEQIQTSGNSIKWSDVVVGQILKNTIYKGLRKYRGEKISDDDTSYTGEVVINKNKEKFKRLTFDAPELAIISTELFDRCNEMLKSKITRNFLTSYEYLLKDLIKCGCCGRNYMGKYVNNPAKGDKVYRCTSNLKKGEGCKNRSINISLIESVLYNEILNSENLLKSLENPNSMIDKIKIELRHSEQLLKNEQKFLKEKQNQIENLLRATTLSTNPNLDLYARLESEIQSEIEASKAKILLLNKDIFLKNSTIKNFNLEATSIEMIKKAKNNRQELTSIFRQFIKGIIINDLGNGYVLATVTISIKGIEYLQKLKLFIFANGVRKYGGRNEKKYRYLPVIKFSHDPVYKNNILMGDIEDIKQEFDYLVDIQNNNSGLIKINKFVDIKKENRLFINECDL